MAESLKVQPAGLQFKIPQVDFTASRVQAQAMSELSANLDQMNNFIGKIAQQRAKIEGAEYGTATAPTQEQIEDAYSSGEEIPIGGDKFSVYGQSVRNAQLTLVHDELEYLARNKLASVVKNYNTGVEQYSTLTNDQKTALSPDNLKNEFDEIIAGYASTLDETSPGFARKFRATLNMVSNSNYVSYADKFVKEEMAYNKGVAIASTELYVNNMNDTIKGYLDRGYVDTKLALELDNKEQMSKIIDFGGNVEGFNNRFKEAVKTTTKNIVVNELLTLPKPSQFLTEMHNGDFEGLPKNIGKAMKLAEDYGVNRYDFIKQVKEQLDDIKQAKKAKDDAIKADNSEEINLVMADAILLLAKKDQDGANALMEPYFNQKNNMPGIDEELLSWSKIIKTYEKAKGSNIKDDPTTLAILTDKLYSPTKPLTLDELTKELGKTITRSTFTSMATKINSLGNQQMSEARTYIADMTGHDQTIKILDKDSDDGLKETIFREIMSDLFISELDASEKGEPFSPKVKAIDLWKTKGVELKAQYIKNNRKLALDTLKEMATFSELQNYNKELMEKFAKATDQDLDSLLKDALDIAELIIAEHGTTYQNLNIGIIRAYPPRLSREMK